MRRLPDNRGAKNPAAKLTEAAVAEMRRRYRTQQPRCTVKSLASEYGVAYYAVWSAIHYVTWAHVRAAA